MSIKEQYFQYLDHIGSSITIRELALEMAHYEHKRGIRAIYFLLHTIEYWDDSRFLLKCRQLQEYGHEIGIHLNVLTQWMQGELLTHLRSSGLEIVGTSAHGETACYSHSFINYWIWKELLSNDPTSTEQEMSAEGIKVDDANWQVQYPADHQIIRDDNSKLKLWQSSLSAHGLTYDAVHVPHTNYWSDTGGKWAKVNPDDGCAIESDVYYSAQLNYKIEQGLTVRVYLLLYDKRGKQISKRQIAVLRSGSEQLNLSFTTHPDANHFAIGLFLGFESPEHQLVLSKVLMNAVTLSDNYHVRYNIKSTEILEPVVNQSAIDPM